MATPRNGTNNDGTPRYRVITGYLSGRVHVASSVRHFHVLECNGRAVSGSVQTDEPVNCKSCLKRFAGHAELLGILVEPKRSVDSHDALEELLGTVRSCEAGWTFDDRLDLAVNGGRTR